MPRARNPDRDRAFLLYKDSSGTRTNRSIAEEIKVDEKIVAVWKGRDKWNEQLHQTESVVQQPPERCTTKRKRGGQPGNKNGVGAGAPKGNRNSVVTGAFATIFYDGLDEDERRLLCEIDVDKRGVLLEQIKTLLIRERRMMKEIANLRAGESTVTRNTSISSVPSGKKKADGTKSMEMTSVRTDKEASHDRILRFEHALTGVQAELRRCIDSMRQLDGDDSGGEQVVIVDDL